RSRLVCYSLRPLDGFVMSPKPFDSCECCFSPPLALGMPMYTLDLSAWFPQPFGLSGHHLAALSGGVSVSFSMLCMPVCTFDVSEWFPQLFGSSECASTIFASSWRGSTWLVRSASGSIAMGSWSRDGCGWA
ncbi:hypothetical protein SCLCIDRAFT_1213006, partial [Scleroderma citrinum Foug A]